ncbi:MAG: beta-glucosidase BglX [Dysgonamonadaceae bacterium]|jgi:beta-glucosidase|nr:beta-glucosidase BglX [Dysgonamonadaceae bacterium]
MKMNKVLKILVLCLTGMACFACKSSENPEDKILESKIDKLLSQMTLEEKIGQMTQIDNHGDIKELVQVIKEGKIGSLLNVSNPETANVLQKAATESRLGIPIIIGRDVIHGFKTIFPIPLGQAATFDSDLVYESAAVAAAEARSTGIHWTFAPMLDISRDARWGRIAESLGEDPYLAGVLGAAMVKGFQGENLSDATSIAACAKHFMGYGAAEAGRDYNSTNIPPALMRNVYLRPFEEAVKASVATVMTSFNDNDGIPSTANSFILQDVLRKEWKFDGFVVSDWASISEMINHGFAADLKEAAQKAANAGVNMDMMSMAYPVYLPDLAKEGNVKESVINEAVREILRIKFRLGLFDNPYVDTDQASLFYKEDHLNKARKAVEESVVLLKNANHTLPLNTNIRTLAVIGPMADAPHDQLGTWCFDGEKTRTLTPLKALNELYGDRIKIVYEKGLDFSRDRNQSQFGKAVQAARNADATVVFVGEESILSGEAHSLADISLKGAQKALVQELKKASRTLIVVVMAGRPLTIGDEVETADALLYSFHPGTMGGPAIADILFGKVVPSGKLPVTFPKEVGQIPVYYNHNNTGRPSNKTETLLYDIPLEAGQVSLGNTSYHLDAGFDPLFPFGFGLSYTTFEYNHLHLNKTKLKAGENMEISVNLTNSGLYDATEVVQLYVRDISGSLSRPVKELKAFRRVSTKAATSQTVKFVFSTNDLAFWGIDGTKKVEPGAFKLWVGGDSNSGLEADFSIAE